MLTKLLLALVALFSPLVSESLVAQESPSDPPVGVPVAGRPIRSSIVTGRVNGRSLSLRQKAAPKGDRRPAPVPAPARLERVEEVIPPLGHGDSYGKGAVVPPLPGQSFIGMDMDFAGNGFPPDTQGAVGPDHIVIVVNFAVRVIDRATLTSIALWPLDFFFEPTSQTDFQFDSRVLYDVDDDVWIITCADGEPEQQSGPTNYIDVAISETSDPMGDWFLFSFATGIHADYPTMGVDDDGLYIAANDPFSTSDRLWAIDKQLIIDEGGLSIPVDWTIDTQGALQPAHTIEGIHDEYLIRRNGSSAMRLYQVTGPMSAPVLTNLGTISVPSFTDPPNAPALGSSANVEVIDARCLNAVARVTHTAQFPFLSTFPRIWTCHNINISGRSACRWYCFQPSNMALIDSGTISDPVWSYYYPSTAVNSWGDVVLGFSGSHAGAYIGSFVSGRQGSEASAGMSTPSSLMPGQDSYNVFDGTRLRWGDYSATCVDPRNDTVFWTFQEFAWVEDFWATAVGQYGWDDCNGSLVLDQFEVDEGLVADCDANGVPDSCDLASGAVADCNLNDVADPCDIEADPSLDKDANGYIDACQETLTVGVGTGYDYATIEAAIAASKPGDTVLLADGTYTGLGNKNLTFSGKNITVRSEHGAATCIMDLEHSGRAFSFDDGEARSARVKGITIKNGSASWGAGILSWHSSPTIVDCVMSDCIATGPLDGVGTGGAILIDGGSPLVAGCRFSNNRAYVGGAIAVSRGSAFHFGSGIEGPGSAIIQDCLIVENHALNQYIFTGASGGGIYLRGDATTVLNCTITGGEASYGGGGIALGSVPSAPGAESRVVSSIVRNNTAGAGAQIMAGNGTQTGTLIVAYSDVQGGQGGVAVGAQFTLIFDSTNIDADPAWKDAAAGDYHLLTTSPCVNAGDPALAPPITQTDVYGEARFIGSRVDVGGDEAGLGLTAPKPGLASMVNTFQISGAVPLGTVYFTYGFTSGSTNVPGCSGLTLPFALFAYVALTVDSTGSLALPVSIPASASGVSVYYQVLQQSTCQLSNLVQFAFP